MPLTINVGLSRKASRDYQSIGVSINVTAELDQTLLAKPNELQQQVADLYAQARSALDRQARGPASPPSRPAQPTSNGHTNGNGHRDDSRMTESQRRAIEAIALKSGANPEQKARFLFRIPLANLTLKQASEMIDHLKSLPTNGRMANTGR